ncbi:MAG TPA: PAS domain S-box protein [Oscillatoriales cyanobacterium M4454_W2019_049]|nr:PAS domain S-box protein [Oscillatoriales cyanobacterium M4454_W2019_049]
MNVIGLLTTGESLLATSFMPHGTCYLWQPGLVALHLVSNAVIALSYFSIPFVLVRLVGRRHDLPFNWVFSLFAAFIMFCGCGHLMDIWTLWYPNYWWSGAIRALTALVSVGTAIVLWVFFPQIVSLPSPVQMEETNRQLGREIEERQRVEQELRKERQFFQALLANLSDGIVACDANGVLTLFSRATQEFHGLPMEAIAAEDWGQYYDLYRADGKTPLTRDEIPLFRALQGESVRDVEMAIAPKNGTIRYILANGDPIVSPEGEKLGAVVAMRDISDRKASELRLRDSERRFRAIFNSMYQFIGLLQPDGTLLEANQTALDFFGITIEGVRGRPFWEMPWGSSSQEVQVRVRHEIERAAGGEFVRYEAEVRGAGGTRATLDFSLKPVFDEAGEVVLLIPEGRDITERKRAEMALKASEERWQLILVGTGDGIFDWNILTGEVFFSPLLKAQLGYADDELENTYEGWERLLHPEDRDRTLAAVRSHLDGETPHYSVEYRLRCRDGSYKWILARGIVQRNAAGNPVRMVGSHQEIGARKNAETALRESLARYRLLAENSSDLIATQSLDGTYLYVSPTCQRLLGYAADDLTGRSIFEFLHPEDADALQKLQAATGQFPTQSPQSYRVRRADGTYIWLETTYQISQHLEDGNTQLVVSISRDITERKQAEVEIVTLNKELERELIERRSKLKIVNRLYRAAINSVREVIFQTDKTGRWTFLSPAWEEITGFSVEQSLNTYFVDCVYPRRDQQRVSILFQDTIEGRRDAIRYEFRTPTRDGGFRWVQMFAQIDADEDERALGIYGTLNDITDRQQAEALLKSRADELLKQQSQIELQNLQLQEAARLKSQFLATMSHELRTPLNAIMGFSQLLQTQQHGELSQRQQDMIDRIFNNSRNLLEMLNEILDFSRLEIGSIDIKPAPFEVGLFVRLVAEELRSLAEKKKLTLDVRLDVSDPQIVSDRTALRRVLVNLISNAIKFTETGGVTVEVREVAGDRIAISVTDTGIGMAPENLEQIFEAFHQVDRSLTRKYCGTGLGLAISKTLVELIEGTISVDSELGRGSTFRVEIPRQLTSSASNDVPVEPNNSNN